MIESKDLLGNILCLDPSKRLAASEILCHSWFDILYQESHHLKSSNPQDSFNPSSEEFSYMSRHFESLGFDVEAIHDSVKKDKCDALSSLWYLTSGMIKKNGMKSSEEQEGSSIKLISRSNSTPKSPTKEEVMALASEANRRRLSDGVKVRSLHRNIEPEESKYKSRPSSASSIISRTNPGRKIIKEEEEEQEEFVK